MSRELHPNAAVRLLRNHLARLEDQRPEAVEAINDPLLPAGVAQAIVREIDMDILDLKDALEMLAVVDEMDLPTARGAA